MQRVTCAVCVAPHRSCIPCASCGLQLCRPCGKRCAIDFPPSHTSCLAACPGCARPWDTEELVARCGRAFWANHFRRARRQLLVARERGRLDSSRAAALREREMRRLRAEARQLAVELRTTGDLRLAHAIATVHRDLVRWQRDRGGMATHTVMRCAHSGCSALVDETGRCPACQRATCARCGEAMGSAASHTCNEDVVRSVEAIARDCRPCVRCGVPSLKTEGCPVMWCVACHTFWNWDTGRVIETRHSVPHNPDHREWTAAGHHPREVGDIPCGGLPDGRPLHMALMREFSRYMEVHPLAPVIVDAADALHMAQRLRHEYPRVWDDVHANEALRIELLNGDMDEADFAVQVERQDRARHYRRDVGMVLETLVFAGADILQHFCAGGDGCGPTAERLMALHTLCDVALARVGTVHARLAPRLDERWRWELPYQRAHRRATA